MEGLQRGDPSSVGGYRLLGRLGSGGMGQVFLGVSPSGRRVAVKLIHPVHAGQEHFRERFAREIEAARRVGGFHTAPVVDADPRADPPWMVTAYIDGPSLEEAVRRQGPLPPGRVRALGAGLAEGLAAIHAHGLIHRDLKPGNVIMAEDGPRIIDFGIARSVDSTGLTSTGAVIGTFSYMSPEQIRSDMATPSMDVFSLGCVLAFAVTGRPPFGSDTAAAIMFRIVGQPPDLAGVADAGVRDLIEGCLAKSPEDRLTVPAILAMVTNRGAIPAATLAPRAVPVADGRGIQTHPPVGVPVAAPTPPPPSHHATGPLRSPFTGEPVKSLGRVLAVKIGNTLPERPATGLSKADIVYLIPVEGGLSRILAIFSSHYPSVVGPVRSARQDDIKLLRQFGRPAFVWSGARPGRHPQRRVCRGTAAVGDRYRTESHGGGDLAAVGHHGQDGRDGEPVLG